MVLGPLKEIFEQVKQFDMFDFFVDHYSSRKAPFSFPKMQPGFIINRYENATPPPPHLRKKGKMISRVREIKDTFLFVTTFTIKFENQRRF